MEKWLVKNNTGTMLNLPQSEIFFKRSEEIIDLVSHTGRTIADLESDAEIRRNITYNNIETVEKVTRGEDIEGIDELKEKIDILTNFIINKTSETPSQSPSVDINGLEDLIKDSIKGLGKNIVLDNNAEKDSANSEEEEMRQDALKKLIDNASVSEKNLDNFGSQEREVSEDDDFSDIIDF